MPAVTPGTTSNGMPAALSASASSPPRPKTNGSPPLRRTTVCPRRARSISSSLIAACSREPPGRLPTSTSSAPVPSSTPAGTSRSWRTASAPRARVPPSPPAGTSRSWRTASALAISSTARTVSSVGSPGPAPTRNTLPSAIDGLPDQALDDDGVLPLPVEPAMPAVHADLAKPARPRESKACLVLGEDPAEELVVAAPLGLGGEPVEQRPPGAALPRGARHVDGVLADALVHAPVAVVAGARPSEHYAVVLGDDERRRAVAGPAEHVLRRAGGGLERGDPILDALVVDGRNGGGVRGLTGANDHARTVAGR